MAETRLSIAGMMCAGCVSSVEEALTGVAGVSSAQVNLGERTATIEGDYSSAYYFFAAAAICQIKVTINNLNPKPHQGDKAIIKLIEMMGCKVIKNKSSYTVIGHDLNAIRVSMEDCPDLVPTIAVIAAFASGITHLTNISHLKHKETNRLKAVAAELNKMGIKATYTDSDLIIPGGKPNAATIETYNDHRIAMSFAIAGLKVKGIKISNPKTVEKSFPNFFKELCKF